MDEQAKKIRLWAETGDRTDPDDASLDPVLSRAVGWTAEFSAADGETPRRRVVNQIFRELTGAALDVMRHGVLPWDASVEYPQHAITNLDGTLYRALAANTNTSPDAAGQTAWEVVRGRLSAPGAPGQPTAAASPNRLDWRWTPGLDGGSAITSYRFEWRSGSGAWTTVNVATPAHTLTGLANGTTVQARVAAVNAQGTSDYSPTGTATPAASTPGGGAALALRAIPLDAAARLDWLAGDDGGAAIIEYTVQWRSGSQSYASSRQTTTSALTIDIAGLANGAAHWFRVRARNSAGTGAWSNEASATPMAEVAADPVVLTASQDYIWPHAASRAYVIVEGGAGGGGGGGGGGGEDNRAAIGIPAQGYPGGLLVGGGGGGNGGVGGLGGTASRTFGATYTLTGGSGRNGGAGGSPTGGGGGGNASSPGTGGAGADDATGHIAGLPNDGRRLAGGGDGGGAGAGRGGVDGVSHALQIASALGGGGGGGGAGGGAGGNARRVDRAGSPPGAGAGGCEGARGQASSFAGITAAGGAGGAAGGGGACDIAGQINDPGRDAAHGEGGGMGGAGGAAGGTAGAGGAGGIGHAGQIVHGIVTGLVRGVSRPVIVGAGGEGGGYGGGGGQAVAILNGVPTTAEPGGDGSSGQAGNAGRVTIIPLA